MFISNIAHRTAEYYLQLCKKREETSIIIYLLPPAFNPYIFVDNSFMSGTKIKPQRFLL